MTIVGTERGEFIEGTEGDDVIHGLGGDDITLDGAAPRRDPGCGHIAVARERRARQGDPGRHLRLCPVQHPEPDLRYPDDFKILPSRKLARAWKLLSKFERRRVVATDASGRPMSKVEAPYDPT